MNPHVVILSLIYSSEYFASTNFPAYLSSDSTINKMYVETRFLMSGKQQLQKCRSAEEIHWYFVVADLHQVDFRNLNSLGPQDWAGL